MRAVFDNKKGWLVPGDYMKVSIVAPKKVSYLTVPQSCTKGDAMSGYYVWAVDKTKNKHDKTLTVIRKDIKISDAIDNNWIVESGLNKSDEIVVLGIQQVKAAGQKVTAISQKEYEKKQSKSAGK